MLRRTTAVSLALLAFAVAIAGGLWADNSATTTLLRALAALIVFFLIGAFVGLIAQMVLDEHFKHRSKELLEESENLSNVDQVQTGHGDLGQAAAGQPES